MAEQATAGNLVVEYRGWHDVGRRRFFGCDARTKMIRILENRQSKQLWCTIDVDRLQSVT